MMPCTWPPAAQSWTGLESSRTAEKTELFYMNFGKVQTFVTFQSTHLSSFGDSGDVRVEVRGLWVELLQEHADMVKQRLASVSVPHLRQLPQVTQLKASSLGVFRSLVKHE